MATQWRRIPLEKVAPALTGSSTAAFGRKLPFDFREFEQVERPLSVKADVQPGTPEIDTSYRPLYAPKQTFG